MMFKWLGDRSLSSEDRVKIACAIYNKNDPSKLYLPKWLSEEIVSLHNTKPRPQFPLTHLWRLLAVCLQDGKQTVLNHLALIHVARDEIACESCAISDVVMCLRNFPDALFRRYDVLIELLGPLIKCGINKIDADQMQDPLLDFLLDLLKKFQYCQCNHGNQKKVFKQFCDNLLWPCLQLRHLCARLETHGDLLASVDKLLASLFHRSHLIGYDSGLASVTASSSYTRHLFESLSVAIANRDGNDKEVITSNLPHLFRLFLEHNRQANNVVKRSTEFRFFQWLLSQLGISEGQSRLHVAKEVNVEAIHKCLNILQEFCVVEPLHDKSSGGSQLKWLENLARGLVDHELSSLAPEVISCLSVLLTIYHPIIEPLLPSLLCQPTCLADSNFMMKLIDVYAKLRQLKEFLSMHLESIKLSHKLTPTAVYSHPVVVHLANRLRHLTTGQVTEIIEMFCSHLQANLPSETSNDDTTNSESPKKKKRKLQSKELMLYQTVDLFCILLDHISLVGVDVSRLIHQQLYHDVVQPLLTLLPSLQPSLVQCSLHLTVSCTRLLGYTELLTNEMLSLVDIHSACGGTHSFITDRSSLLMLKRLISSLVRFDKVEKDELPDLLNFILEAPAVYQSNWDGQWLNVRQAINIPVANWRLITSELPYVYSLCSDHHLLPVAGVIIDVFTSSMDQVFNDDGDDNNDGLTFVGVTLDFMTSCAFQEMSLLHTLLLQCMFQKIKLTSSKLPKAIRKAMNGLCKMFSLFDGAKLSSHLTAVLSASDNLDVHQLEIWNESIVSIVEILRYLPIGRMSASHLVMCGTLIVVWLFTVSTSSLANDQWLKYTLLLAWLLKAIKDHPHRKRYMASFPFLAIHEWICSLLLDKDYCIASVWPACKATLVCTASCDPSVMSSVITICTQRITQHSIDSHAFSVITEIASTSLNAIIKEIKLPLPEAISRDVSQLYHVIQQIIRKACKRKFTMLLSSPSLISLYVTATSSVSEDSVDNAVSSSLLRGVQNVLQDDSLAELHDNSIAISKKYCSVIDILTLALMRGHSVMAVWQTGSQLWRILLSDPSLSADGLPHSKLNSMMSKLVTSCSTEDVKIMFESLLSEEIPSHLLFIKQWQLIVTSKMSNDTRKTFNHYLSRLICKCMEVLMVGNGSSEILHDTISLVTKLLTMCTEHDSRSVMLTLHACLLPQQQQMQQQQHYLKWIGLCIGVLSTILRYHLNTAISCAPVVFTAIGKLMVSIIEVAQCRGASDTLDDIVTLTHNLCKVIELVSAEVKFTKFAPHLIAVYLLQAGGEHGGDIPDIIKEILLSGIYLLLRLCTEHETSFLNATLDDCSRELFKSILFDYNKLHKYKGKV